MKHKNNSQVWIGTSALLLFIGLAFLVVYIPSSLNGFDHSLKVFIQSFRTANLTKFFKLITEIGNPIPFILINIVVVAWLTLRKHWQDALFFILTTLTATGVNHLIKGIIKRPRPKIGRLIPIGGYSFPSGHSIASMALFGALIIITAHLVKNNLFKWVADIFWVLGIILVPISRVYLNVHHPSDIVGGMLLGFVILTIYNQIIFAKSRRR
ncbi:phosphatase PAP2 family protein [Pediococcus argentinicus]|uniref:phosphatase PAP2 family protein n=1 Tax=Pediococcus argentinicus TaxID=480391 RepID=UPI00339008A0